MINARPRDFEGQSAETFYFIVCFFDLGGLDCVLPTMKEILTNTANPIASKTFEVMKRKLTKNGAKYGVFYRDGYCDLFTNAREEAVNSYWYLPAEKRGCVIENI